MSESSAHIRAVLNPAERHKQIMQMAKTLEEVNSSMFNTRQLRIIILAIEGAVLSNKEFKILSELSKKYGRHS